MQDENSEGTRVPGAPVRTETGPAGGRLGSLLPARWFGNRDASADTQAPGTTEVPNKLPNRDGEKTRLWFRTDRVFFQDGGWYIATREGLDVGPYADAKSARREAKQLIKLLIEAEKSGAQAQALTIQQFMYRPRLGNRR